jgi:glycosyltransferase involved in cell wall biosynthesis
MEEGLLAEIFVKLVSFVMPALNEEDGIESTIHSIPKSELKKAGYDTEVVVVDGGSTDRTVALARKAGARVILAGRGYGLQYKIGLAEARGDIIVTGDSDGTYPFQDSPNYIRMLEGRSLDFITVNRFAYMDKDAMYFSNKVGNFGLTLFTNILFGFKIKDSQSGMWIIRSSILPRLNVQSDGMPFSQEIKIEAFRKARSIEVGGRYMKRIGQTKLSKLKDGFGNLYFLFSKRFSG